MQGEDTDPEDAREMEALLYSQIHYVEDIQYGQSDVQNDQKDVQHDHIDVQSAVNNVSINEDSKNSKSHVSVTMIGENDPSGESIRKPKSICETVNARKSSNKVNFELTSISQVFNFNLTTGPA